MDDIVKRLRSVRSKDVNGAAWVIVKDAADEIDRLRLTLQSISRMAIANIEKPIPGRDD